MKEHRTAGSAKVAAGAFSDWPALAGWINAEAVPYTCQGRLSTLSKLFATHDELICIIAPGQTEANQTTALAHALAHQHDRVLTMVLPVGDELLTGHRLTAFDTPARMFSYGEDLTVVPYLVPSRAQVDAHYAGLPGGSTGRHTLPATQLAWWSAVVDAVADLGAVESGQVGSRTLKVAGSNLAQARGSKGGLKVTAGLKTKQQHVLGTNGHVEVLLTSPPTAEQVARLAAAIRADVPAVSAMSLSKEHRFQHDLGADGLACLSLGGRSPAREYPGRRSEIWYGALDFLGIDDRGELHVVETKIGADSNIVLQVVDYAHWVRANEAAIRVDRGWPPAPRAARVHVDLVLGRASVGAPVGDRYLAGQLEVLDRTFPARVWVADDVAIAPTALRQVTVPELFADGSGVSAPWHPRRFRGRTIDGLRGAPE